MPDSVVCVFTYYNLFNSFGSIPWYVSLHTTINLTLSVGEETNVCRLVNISNSVRKIMMEYFIVTGCKPAPANILKVH